MSTSRGRGRDLVDYVGSTWHRFLSHNYTGYRMYGPRDPRFCTGKIDHKHYEHYIQGLPETWSPNIYPMAIHPMSSVRRGLNDRLMSTWLQDKIGCYCSSRLCKSRGQYANLRNKPYLIDVTQRTLTSSSLRNHMTAGEEETKFNLFTVVTDARIRHYVMYR